ncbi:hypothetical protein B0H11DRAFT_1921947 [Mycena galericulata]|nr:hypothetical protein B0H11DRAFT_1921947 [Mycena galericulata]
MSVAWWKIVHHGLAYETPGAKAGAGESAPGKPRGCYAGSGDTTLEQTVANRSRKKLGMNGQLGGARSNAGGFEPYDPDWCEISYPELLLWHPTVSAQHIKPTKIARSVTIGPLALPRQKCARRHGTVTSTTAK